MSSLWDKLWIVWVIGFFAIEIPAVVYERKHGSGATLSAHLRFWFSTRKLIGPYPHLRRVVAICVLAWLPLHLLFSYA
jgi:hypothetical protein